MTENTRRRLTAGKTKEEAEKAIARWEALTADLDKYIAEHYTGGDEDVNETNI